MEHSHFVEDKSGKSYSFPFRPSRSINEFSGNGSKTSSFWSGTWTMSVTDEQWGGLEANAE